MGQTARQLMREDEKDHYDEYVDMGEVQLDQNSD